MKIKTVILKNFRRYKDEVRIPFSNLTVFVDKNDIGKTSILEALDIFFNGLKANEKISIDDLNIDAKNNDNKEILIGVEFSELPKNLVIDSSYNTTLKDEYLLNENANLEILKYYKGETLKESVFIRANHPNNELCSNLLAKKNSELKKIVEQNEIPCQNKTSNSELRKSIWNFYKDSLGIKLTDIEVSKEDAKNIWIEIEKKLPAYSLFAADRKNEDGDSEVQDPLKETVKQIFKDNAIVVELDKIAAKVREELKKVSDETLQKLNEISPEISDDLHPNIGNTVDLKWCDVFKNVSIAGENDIPLNKRGSGFRRLVLLSFFAAEADREDSNKGNGVIYAFEEPETSQHSNNQKLLMDAFKKISKKENRQVLLTTHSPIIVKTLCEINSTKPLYENVVLLKEKSENTEFKIESLIEAMLPFPSINEVIYLAFDEVSEEYHDELYSFLQEKGKIESDCPKEDYDEYVKNSGIKKCSYKKVGKSETFVLSLTKYIRNQIHHPENKLNQRYSENDLRESIDCMRKYIVDNRIKLRENLQENH